MRKAVEQNKKTIPWIIQQYRNGAEIASLCVGSFSFSGNRFAKGKEMLHSLGFCE